MAIPSIENLAENVLLAKLRDDDRRRLAPHMTAMDFQAKRILQRAGDDVVDTWFAMDAFSIWSARCNTATPVACRSAVLTSPSELPCSFGRNQRQERRYPRFRWQRGCRLGFRKGVTSRLTRRGGSLQKNAGTGGGSCHPLPR
jgi:hypothetical protein